MENLLVSSDSGIPGLELPGLFEFLSVFFLATLRIGAFLISAPFFGAQSIPLQGADCLKYYPRHGFF
jgi:flagellar biosynthetic protein FliR